MHTREWLNDHSRSGFDSAVSPNHSRKGSDYLQRQWGLGLRRL